MKINVRKQAGFAVAAAFALSAFMPTLSAAPLASGDSITIANGVYGTTSGGEFAITYGSGSFISFCLETGESIAYGTPYTVTFNSDAVLGGGVAANAGLGDVAGSLGVSDPLSNSTAWLYTQYLAGALSGQGANNASADKAQQAIWFLENESLGVSNSWVTDAYTAVGLGWVNPTGPGHVYVLNLTNPETETIHQDQLYMVPVPEPETYAMLLAGLGLMGFVARRRQRKLASA